MRGIVLKDYVKSVKELRVTETTKPDTGIIIKIDCVAANFFDILQVQGKYQTQPPFPWIAGFEFAGTIVNGSKAGQRVFGGSQGAFAEYISVESVNSVLAIPDNMSFEEASTLFVTAPTSYLAIVIRAKSKPGEIVLVHAGAGGVGLMAVQFAKIYGCVVIATASSLEKLEICKEFGADYAINYQDADWIDQVKRITNGKGCDVIYDPVGMVDLSLKLVAWNGRILVVGFAAGKIEKIAMNKLLLKHCSVMGVYWGGFTIKERQLVPVVWKEILGLIKDKKLKAPVYSKLYFGLESIPEALDALASRKTWGKVVIKVANQTKL